MKALAPSKGYSIYLPQIDPILVKLKKVRSVTQKIQAKRFLNSNKSAKIKRLIFIILKFQIHHEKD